ncbi:MAG: glycine zipper 2TM domain-containing protein [Brevundimonas sp.]|uniref:glycine zipper 2TM domain-containing protein n=1 Tax=Brevundimonas sp. TaxID=1871086 RepID=UPI0025BD6096|nr:glycine zipper 2TM domain-containing protein [Brevundimonas sp.]MBX3476535.1 glycine zipper 2TM domain-containing protein [Brevundimonas sp.]
MIGAKTKIAAAATVIAALMVPGAASAQSAYYGGGYGQNYGRSYNNQAYDPCYRDGRTGAGGVIGATAGAVLGSQIAARGRRTEGSVLGGVLGAVVGSQIGRSSSQACYSQQGYGYQAPSYNERDGRYDNAYSQGRYDERYEERYEDRYDDRYDSRYQGGYSDRGYDYDRGGDCRMAESRIRLPDGRYETRYVRSCRDSSGRYRVVD